MSRASERLACAPDHAAAAAAEAAVEAAPRGCGLNTPHLTYAPRITDNGFINNWVNKATYKECMGMGEGVRRGRREGGGGERNPPPFPVS